MLPVSLRINSRLLVVRFWGKQVQVQVIREFLTTQGSAPLTPVLFKGQLQFDCGNNFTMYTFLVIIFVTFTILLTNFLYFSDFLQLHVSFLKSEKILNSNFLKFLKRNFF